MKKCIGIGSLLLLLVFAVHMVFVAERTITYDTDIKPLMDDRGCGSCHSDFAGSYESLLTRKSNGILLVNTAYPDSSVLIWRIDGETISGDNLIRMPYGGPYYSEEEINLFKTWIAQGAMEDVPVGIESTHTWSEIKSKFH